MTDTSERADLVRRLEQVARFDHLTGLLNRRGTLERLEAALPGPGPALALLDLRRLRRLNNDLGHTLVDEVIRIVAQRLSADPAIDWAGRVGPGEFLVQLRPTQRDLEAVAECVRRVARPIELDRWTRTPELVAAVVRPTPGHLDPDQVMRDLDHGIGRAEIGAPLLVDDAIRAERLRRSRVEHDLGTAIAGGELRFRYQPIIDLATERIAAVEALARWNHPILGAIPPSEFISVAENTHLIHGLGQRALEDSVGAMARWRAAGTAPGHVHVNVSAVQLTDAGLVGSVADMIEDADLEPERVEIEVTESAVLDAAGTWRRTLSGLRDLGVRVAIDDFGAGYSSILSLREVQADTVKLDRSMLRDLVDDDGARSLVRTTIDLAHQFGMQVVAEGVEFPEEHALLRDMGCDLGQGWLWHRDLDESTVAGLIADGR